MNNTPPLTRANITLQQGIANLDESNKSQNVSSRENSITGYDLKGKWSISGNYMGNIVYAYATMNSDNSYSLTETIYPNSDGRLYYSNGIYNLEIERRLIFFASYDNMLYPFI